MGAFEQQFTKGTVQPKRRAGGMAWYGYFAMRKTGDGKRPPQFKTWFDEIPCNPRKDAPGKYTNATKAEKAFGMWRDETIANLKAEEEKKRVQSFAYATTAVTDFTSMYLEECEAKGLEPSTIVGYRKSCNRITAFFGDRPVGTLTDDDIKDFEVWLDTSKHLAPTTRAKTIKMLKAAYDAHREQIGANQYPFADLRNWIPRASNPDPNPLTPESVAKVIDDLESNEPTQFLCAVELALRTGMRQSEICALKWEDCDLETGAIHVCRAIGRASGSHAVYLKKPKDTNLRSRKKHDPTRWVPASGKVCDLLNRRRDFVITELLESNPNLTDAEIERRFKTLYVCGSIDGRFYNPEILSRDWRGYSRTLKGTKGRRPTFHHLRDTCATFLKDHTDFKTVAKILGHEDAAFTMRYYADSTKEAMEDAMAGLDEAF